MEWTSKNIEYIQDILRSLKKKTTNKPLFKYINYFLLSVNLLCKYWVIFTYKQILPFFVKNRNFVTFGISENSSLKLKK